MGTTWIQEQPMVLPIEVEAEHRVIVFDVARRQRSNYMRDEIKETYEGIVMPENPLYVDCTSVKKIMSTSAIDVYNEKTKRFERKLTRYMKNFDSFYVDDQKRAKVEPNPLDDAIFLQKGQLVVTNDAESLTLYNYLTMGYSGNINFNEQGGKTRRIAGAQNVIKELNMQLSAVKEVVGYDEHLSAMKFLSSLKYKEGGKTFYNEDKIKFLSQLFKLPSFTSGYREEAFISLYARINKNPKEFLSTVGSARALYEKDVAQAMTEGLITVTEDSEWATFSNGKHILQYKDNPTYLQKIEQLIDYVANPENLLVLEQIRVMLLSNERHNTSIVGD